MDDCLDSYIVGACMHLLKLQDIDADSTRKQPLFDVLPDEEKYNFIYLIARDILEKYIKITDEVSTISQRTSALDEQTNQIKRMFNNQENKYICEVCTKKYKTPGGLKRHLKKDHDWDLEIGEPGTSKSEYDHIALYRASFMKCALLLRDTNDAYKMGDGDRILCNAKFQMLLSRAGNHTKYQLWLFRFIAYCVSLLSPQMAYEYKWNCCTNLHGGTGHNIPNDNLVELLVQAIKKKVYAQGSNATYESVRKAALSTQIQEEITTNLENECNKKQSGTKRSTPSKHNDITAIISELNSAKVFDYIPGREYTQFPKFSEVFSCIQVDKLYKWITENKERLSYESV